MTYTTKMLSASERCCEHLIAAGSASATVAELADAAGVPERTFYRWFPTKEACVAPVLDAGSTRLAAHFRTAGGETLADLMLTGYEVVLGESYDERTMRLFPILHSRKELWAEVARAVNDGEHLYRPDLAGRLGVAPDAPLALVAASAVSSAFRQSVDLLARAGDDPRRTFRLLVEASPTTDLAVSGAA
ncbi:TetR/AcrR family transcriptional regulator [Nocardioides hwasunensis]|uniref:TetR/AcrR family transcriptional regulator n=1 Tax=Nocardioides hwasunensis TaxID=397258 RepID=A0ABR8MIH8_9ACTN|nr:TetR/AcrR family transcriptional regulator [Nocardioides hwasunensis]MBD3915076.1 TetR/AcrR family transcriptional regulator [Nocardioides hwasunensis]